MKFDDIPFIINDINNEMPLLTDTTAKIPYSFNQFPKSLKEESYKINEKYLDKHLHEIEEMAYKFPNNYFINWFKQYQSKYFVKSIGHDTFFKNPENNIKYYMPWSGAGMSIGFGTIANVPHVNGSTLTMGGSSHDDFNWATGIIAGLLPTATVGQYYDQAYLTINTAAGNQRLGVYDGNTSAPNNLLGETGSLSCINGSVYRSITEFAITTTDTWLAFQLDNNSCHIAIITSGGRQNGRKAWTYGSFQNPVSGLTIPYGYAGASALSHS